MTGRVRASTRDQAKRGGRSSPQWSALQVLFTLRMRSRTCIDGEKEGHVLSSGCWSAEGFRSLLVCLARAAGWSLRSESSFSDELCTRASIFKRSCIKTLRIVQTLKKALERTKIQRGGGYKQCSEEGHKGQQDE